MANMTAADMEAIPPHAMTGMVAYDGSDASRLHGWLLSKSHAYDAT